MTLRSSGSSVVWIACALAVLSACGLSDADGPDSAGTPPTSPPSSRAARATSLLAQQRSAPAHLAWQSTADDARVARGPRGSFALTESGLRLEPTAADEGWSLSLRTTAFGREGAMRAWTAAPTTVEAPSLEVRAERGDVTERWLHGPLGVEHAFTIAQAPSGSGELTIALQLTGLRAESLDATTLLLRDAQGIARARYAELFAHDADGRELPARFVIEGTTVRVLVDDREARYPVVIDPLLAVEEASLPHTASGSDDRFGTSVALSADGTRALIGAPWHATDGLSRAGAGFVYRRASGTWAPESTLRAYFFGPAANDEAGAAVALSGDGTIAVVGAPRSFYSVPFAGGLAGVVYTYVFVEGRWVRDTLLETSTTAEIRQGAALALTPDARRLVVGAPRDFTNVSGTFPTTGGASVYERSAGGWNTRRVLSLRSSDPGAGDEYGAAVGIRADGTVIVVGAPADDTAAGTDAGSVAVVDGLTGAELAVLRAPDGAPSDRFGTSVAISGDGGTIAVGAPGDDTATGVDAGSVRVFVRDGSGWAPQATLTPSGAVAMQGFGHGLALSADGSTLLATSAQVDTAGGPDPAHARVFVRSGTTWTEDTPIRPTGASESGGQAVALTADASVALLGAPREGAGRARVFVRPALGLGAPCARDGQCASGFCADGVCCDSACGSSSSDCRACSRAAGAASDGRCGPLSEAVAPTVTCRPSVGACDVPEVCIPGDGVCPADAARPEGTACGAAPVEPCDAPDRCVGTVGATATCEPRVATAGTQCRAGAECDAPETCDGVSTACPEDRLHGAGHVCRPAISECDAPDVCDGVSFTCPEDGAQPEGTACGAPPSGPCDRQDVCVGRFGSTASCQATFAEPGTVCRPAEGACDAGPDRCTGFDPDCPPGPVRPIGTVCRAAVDACDLAEQCDGFSPICPADATLSVGTVCAPAFGDCDEEDVCVAVGGRVACEPRIRPAGYVCRAAGCFGDTLRTAVQCDGTSFDCPASTLVSCAPYRCGSPSECLSTCSSNADCVSSVCRVDGTCGPGGDLGDACTRDDQCGSGRCVDGVCCLTACNGVCEACDVPGQRGRCVPVIGPPHGARTCPSDGTVCGTRTCAGAPTACTGFPSTETVCRSPSCSGGVATLEGRCTGSGACEPEMRTPCTSGACSGASCAAACVVDGDCPPGGRCELGTCRFARGPGEACTDGAECATGACVDGVCCDRACDGQCEACDVRGTEGRCVPVVGAPHGDRPACDGAGTACGGTCDGSRGDACRLPGPEVSCGAPRCEGDVAVGAGVCDAAGGCDAPTPRDCRPYGCEAGACLASCEGDEDCAARFRCEGGECVPDEGPVDGGPVDGGSVRDASVASDAGLDGGRLADGGAQPIAGGCGCRVSEPRGSGGAGALGLVLAALLWCRRRRR